MPVRTTPIAPTALNGSIRTEKLVADAFLATCPKLPPELVDLVIDFLRNDVRALATCALTCRSWLPRSRYHMFRQVRLHCRSRETFEALLAQRPELGMQVRELLTMVTRSENRPTWVDRALPNIVLKLPNVTKVVVKGPGVYRSLPLGSLLKLRELVLSSCDCLTLDEFAGLVGSLPRLETIIIENTDVSKHTPLSFRATVDRPVLKNFECIYSPLCVGSFSDWIVRESMHTALESITLIPVPRIAIPALGRMIDAVQDTLKHLTLAFVSRTADGDLCDILNEHVHLERCTSLRTLHFGSPASNGLQYGADDISFCWVAALLAQMASLPLERLSFSLWHGDHKELDRPHWNTIVRQLLSSDFKHIQSVTFNVWGPHEPMGRLMIKRLKEQLVDLEDQDKLIFDCMPE